MAWLALGVSCAAYLVVSLMHHQAFHPWGRLNYFDLRVYRGAARLVVDGGALYGGPIWHWAPFTYPPFAAVLFTPLALLPLALDEAIVTVFGVVALFAILSLALRLPTGQKRRLAETSQSRFILVPLAMAAGLWLEPITATLAFGQINLLIALLVVSDLARPDGARGKGALIGLAAGLKLTPLIFVPYLLLSRRPRAACVALGTFAGTIAVGYAALPGDSQRFWADGLVLDPRRAGGGAVPANQSLRGLMLRLDPSIASWQVLAIAVSMAVAGIALAVVASRRGDEATGFSLCALTGLLVSPVSWTHHWTLATPALLLLGVRVIRRRSRLGIAALVLILMVGYSDLPKLMSKPALAPGRHPSLGWMLASAPYVLMGLCVLAAGGVCEVRRTAATTRPRLLRTRGRDRRLIPQRAMNGHG